MPHEGTADEGRGACEYGVGMGEACPDEPTFEIMMSMSAVEVSVGGGFNDGYDYVWTVEVVVRVHGAKASRESLMSSG